MRYTVHSAGQPKRAARFSLYSDAAAYAAQVRDAIIRNASGDVLCEYRDGITLFRSSKAGGARRRAFPLALKPHEASVVAAMRNGAVAVYDGTHWNVAGAECSRTIAKLQRTGRLEVFHALGADGKSSGYKARLRPETGAIGN